MSKVFTDCEQLSWLYIKNPSHLQSSEPRAASPEATVSQPPSSPATPPLPGIFLPVALVTSPRIYLEWDTFFKTLYLYSPCSRKNLCHIYLQSIEV